MTIPREIPLRSGMAPFRQTTELGGEIYLLSFRYNEALENWIMSISDGLGGLVIGNIMLRTSVKGYPLNTLFSRNALGFPRGEFHLIKVADGKDLGTAHKLVFIPFDSDSSS